MAADGVMIAKSSLDQFICSANEAIEILLARKKDDIEDKSKIFHPEFTHQLFGDNETIFGYKNLRVKLYYSAARLTTYLGMTYTEKVDPDKCDGVQPDEVLKTIHEKLQPGYHSNLDDFAASLVKDSGFVPHGELIHAFTVPDDGEDRQFVIYKSDVTTRGFCDYHERLQTFLFWFIEAASFIDIDDNRWHFYLVYEKYHDDERAYAFAGFATVYHHYAYPNNVRPKISQVLILPPFQCKGIGVSLLDSIYAQYTSNSQVLDITVEDPSEAFTRVRDFVDVKNCLALPTFCVVENLKNGLSQEMIEEARHLLKLNKRQVRRVYEILRLRETNTSNADDYRSYRLEIKKRLNLPYQKRQMDVDKLRRTLQPEEFNATLHLEGDDEHRMEILDRLYEEVEAEYRHTLERLAASKLD